MSVHPLPTCNDAIAEAKIHLAAALRLARLMGVKPIVFMKNHGIPRKRKRTRAPSATASSSKR